MTVFNHRSTDYDERLAIALHSNTGDQMNRALDCRDHMHKLGWYLIEVTHTERGPLTTPERLIRLRLDYGHLDGNVNSATVVITERGAVLDSGDPDGDGSSQIVDSWISEPCLF